MTLPEYPPLQCNVLIRTLLVHMLSSGLRYYCCFGLFHLTNLISLSPFFVIQLYSKCPFLMLTTAIQAGVCFVGSSRLGSLNGIKGVGPVYQCTPQAALHRRIILID